MSALATLFLALALAPAPAPALALQGLATTTAATPNQGAELDLLKALSLHNSTREGVKPSTAMGPETNRPFFLFQGDYRELEVPRLVFLQAVKLLKQSPDFTLATTLRQDKANSGTIISFSHGFNRYLELQSSGRRNEIRLHYMAAGSNDTRVEAFPYLLADEKWHQLALSVSGNEVQVYIDCHQLYKKTIMPPDRNFSQPQLSLWVGQRNNKHSLFKGAFQEIRLISGPHGYLVQCPALTSGCPTCGQFSTLQATVIELALRVQEISLRLQVCDTKIQILEQCDCQKSCTVNGSIYPDGATWQKDCSKCSCVHGDVSCREIQCAPVKCKNPIKNEGDCCPSCLQRCSLNGMPFELGNFEKLMNGDRCVQCTCTNGKLNCTKTDPKSVCPPLPCSPSEQITVPGECCKFCSNYNYCNEGHKCHPNATCRNLMIKYTCTCNEGFRGNGFECEDVDECMDELKPNHCHAHTTCKNVIGSYACECNEGYKRLDKFKCVEIDECTNGEHKCSEHARCINTPGSYSCECIQGYRGDGFHCEPICGGGCLNGGTCQSPDHCICRPGFTGHHCERDLDECATKKHQCPSTANCVNMPGWYYCKCKPGYESVVSEDSQTTVCQDINECLTGLHTCHPSSRCINVEGTYECDCIQPECKLDCVHKEEEMADGSEWVEGGGCETCTCNKGVVTCHKLPCLCQSHNSRSVGFPRPPSGLAPDSCCPQCDPTNDCKHQELHHILFHSGERWVYQCETCECLFGEVDCWKLECPHSKSPIDGAACCEAIGHYSHKEVVETPCSSNSSNPCPYAAHHTAPDCQECDGVSCVHLVGGDRLLEDLTTESPQAPRSQGTTATAADLEPG